MRALSDLEMGRPPALVLCQRLRDKQEYLHGTYAEQVLVLGKTNITDVSPLYEALPPEAGLVGIENRLYQARLILPQRMAEVELMRTRRICQSLFNINGVLEQDRIDRTASRGRRSEYEFALQGNSAFQRLLNRQAGKQDVTKLIQEGFLSVGCGVMTFTREDAYNLCHKREDEVYTLDDLPFTSAVYLLEEVSVEATMRISGIPLRPIFNNRASKVALSEARLGLWDVSQDMSTWANETVAALVEKRTQNGKPLKYAESSPILKQNREWVRDDTLIMSDVRQVVEGKPISTVAIVTEDRSLCKRIARDVACYVVRINPASIIMSYERSGWSESTAKLDSERYFAKWHRRIAEVAPNPIDIFVDTGSFKAVALKMASTSFRPSSEKQVYRRKVIAAYPQQGNRSVVFQYERMLEHEEHATQIFGHSGGIRTFSMTNNPEAKPSKRFDSLLRRFAKHKS